jgi:hypothetical protein
LIPGRAQRTTTTTTTTTTTNPASFRVAFLIWSRTMAAPKTMTAFCRMPDTLLEGVAAVARDTDRNLSSTLRLLVREALQARSALPRNDEHDQKA